MIPHRAADLAPYVPLLDALDGIVYVTNFRGDFLTCGNRRWREFAAENGAPQLAAPTGLNSLASCSDPETASAYAKIYDAFQAGKLERYSFGFRCDTPRVKRELRMALTTLVLEKERVGIIHHCVTLRESERPLLRIMEFSRGAAASMLLIRMCSYCLRIKDEATGSWIEAEDYYRGGGRSDVGISHGICTDCYTRVVVPVLELN